MTYTVPIEIHDLKDGMRKVDIEGEIESVEEPRTVNLRTGGESLVADAVLKDKSGSVKFPLWDRAQIDMVKPGSRVRVTNGYTNTFRGELRLNVGKYGRLEVLMEDENADRRAYYRKKINDALELLQLEAKNHDELVEFQDALEALVKDGF